MEVLVGGSGTVATVESLVEQLRALGVDEGGVLLVHTSFGAVRPVEGGPAGLIRALQSALGIHGTLVMPSWPEDGSTLFDLTSRCRQHLHFVRRPFTSDHSLFAGGLERLEWAAIVQKFFDGVVGELDLRDAAALAYG